VGEQQIEHQADHHRRQTEQRVGADDDRAAPRKSPDRQRCADRQSQQRREARRAEADRQRETNDLPELGAGEGVCQRCEIVHEPLT